MSLEWNSTMSYRRGDVILVRYPHSDQIKYSKRPALVVQADDLTTELNQRIVALITKNIERVGETRVPVSKKSLIGQGMGLLHDSVVVTDNLATVLNREIDKRVGYCNAMELVDSALRKTLAL